jgi:membrane protease YdiL (CAAX protease family)
VTRRPARLLLFFAIAYAITWTAFISVALWVPVASVLGSALILLGAFSPGIAALFLTWRDEGAAGVEAFVGRIFRGPVAAKWIVFAVSYMAVIKLSAAVIHRLGLGEWPRFGTEPVYLMPIAIALSWPFQAGEEVGWRGYALPRLTERFGLAWASVILGVIWAFWHLPQFFIPGADTYHQAFIPWALTVVAISVALAWLYARTRGSLLLVMLLHSAINNTKDIVPSGTAGATNTFGLAASPMMWLTLIVAWIIAGVLLRKMPDRAIG